MEELKEVVERLVKGLEDVEAIILFGSRARGDWLPWSDYDLLIIARFKEQYLDRIYMVLKLLGDVKIPVEPHPYTLEEALNMLRKANPLIVDALEEGQVLYRGRRFEQLLLEYRRLKGRIRRTRTSIWLVGD